MNQGSVWERLRRVDPLVSNGVLAAFLLALQAGPVFLPRERPEAPGVAAVLMLAATVPIAFRRRAPIPVLAIVGAASVVYAVAGYPDGLAPSLAVAAGSAASWTDRATFTAWAVPISVAAGLVLAVDASPDVGNWVDILVATILGVGIPLLIGRILHHRRRRIERDRELAARDAVAAERARIARELHDVVAHAVSVMVVQAGAARTVVDRDPEAARVALGRIEETGRASLNELRRLLGLLKDGEPPAELSPQPGLDQLDELLSTMRASGLPVEATVEGTPRPLAPGADLTAYRVVQEALTNALKHAGDAHTHVRLRYSGQILDVEVADDGRGPAPDGVDGTGHGLIGMRERVLLFGGSLDVGARPGGGFVVRARIPTEVPS
jgi:signal transduction histidine kinase